MEDIDIPSVKQGVKQERDGTVLTQLKVVDRVRRQAMAISEALMKRRWPVAKVSFCSILSQHNNKLLDDE